MGEMGGGRGGVAGEGGHSFMKMFQNLDLLRKHFPLLLCPMSVGKDPL